MSLLTVHSSPLVYNQYLEHQQELIDVLQERTRQLDKFGPQDRPPIEWHAIMAEEMGEMAKEVVEHTLANKSDEDYYKELKEAVAVGLAAMQNYNQRKRRGQ
jgi:hypothetical protein